MNNRSRYILVLAAMAAGALPATARAQYYGAAYSRQPPPLYPYELQSNQPYAVQVAPNTYVIKRPAESRADFDDRPVARSRRVAKSVRPHKRNDPALIEELQRRRSGKNDVINTQRIVRDPPVVIETRRVVDDPPRIVERRHYVDDTAPAPVRRKQAMVTEERDAGKPGGRDDNKKRVIRAEAEVTILGPDRMTIRLFRKRSRGGDTTVRVE
jgi:hypothetical protein